MNATVSDSWHVANQRYLTAHLAVVRRALARHVGAAAAALGEMAEEPAGPPEIEHPDPAALDTLCAIFGLSPFERDIVLLCAGVELEGDFAALCAAAHGDPQRNYPSFGLALAALPGAYWAALSPEAPLRRWQIVQVEAGRALSRSPLLLDERILHYLTGVEYLDERLAGLVRALPAPETLAPSHMALAEQMASAWVRAARAGAGLVAQVCGPQAADRRAVAGAACRLLGLEPALLPAAAIPAIPGELERLLRLWEREAVLGSRGLLLDCDGIDAIDLVRTGAIAQLVETARGPLIVASRERGGPWQRPLPAFDVPRPAPAERKRLWEATLGDHAARLNGQLDRLAAQFDLDTHVMDSAWASALGRLDAAGAPATPEAVADTLWDVCRAQARPKLDDPAGSGQSLAQRIEPAAGWDDLVLPEAQREVLREVAMHVRHRMQVYNAWGFASKGQRGLGI
ncbi:MAG TPA: ATP-binding protein, partial [Roseiflexaceae bacterium]